MGALVEAEEEPELEEEDEEDIFELEGQAQQLHVTQPGVAAAAVEAARGEGARGGFEGAVAGSKEAGPSAASASRSAVRVQIMFAASPMAPP